MKTFKPAKETTLLTIQGRGCFFDPFQNIPEDAIPAAIKEYLGGTEDPV